MARVYRHAQEKGEGCGTMLVTDKIMHDKVIKDTYTQEK